MVVSLTSVGVFSEGWKSGLVAVNPYFQNCNEIGPVAHGLIWINKWCDAA